MTGEKERILVVEDDAKLRRFLDISLTQQGFRVEGAANGAEGIRLAASNLPDLIILDLGLPDMDGVEVIRTLREWSSMPILILSARDQERDKVAALDAGADDYLTKPFGNAELLARIRVAMRHAARRQTQEQEPVFREGELEVDLHARIVRLAGQEIHLTPIEYRLLTALIGHAGKVVTHGQLLRMVWGPNSEEEHQYLRVYMNQLRRKLEPEPAKPKYLLTEPGVGYRFKIRQD
ncbi:MAG: response regulator [Planctomycetota bacterium]|nr:response regulator [Planctomycetota bacterium]